MNKQIQNKIKNYIKENQNCGFEKLWGICENVIDNCFNGDYETYFYTSKGTIYNRLTGQKLYKIDYWKDSDDGNIVYFFYNLIKL